MKKLKIEKRIHKAWKELNEAKIKLPKHTRNIIGKWQFICSSKKGKISLIKLPDYFRDGITLWEIYQLDGKVRLFEDIERFNSKEEAIKRIKELLL